MQTARDKALLCNTLVGILKACEGHRVQIDLRNEWHVVGKVESVSVEMNVVMSNARLTLPSFLCSKATPAAATTSQSSRNYDEITVRGCNIRFVHVPDDVDMLTALQQQVQSIKRVHKPRSTGRRPPAKNTT